MTKPDYSPTPTEIRQRTLEVQSRWSERERRRRLYGRHGDGVRPSDDRWYPPVVSSDALYLAPIRVVAG